MALATFILSCSESALLVENEFVPEQQQLPEGVSILPAVTAAASLDGLGVTFTGGIPEYRDIQHLRQMFKTVQHATAEEYMAWSEANDFTSPYSLYKDALYRAELQVGNGRPFANTDLTVEEQDALFVDEEGSIDIRVKALLPAMIMRVDGKFFVGNSLNQWDIDHHYVIPDRDFELLEKARLNPNTPEDMSYYVNDIIYEEGMFSPGERGADKVQLANFQCPQSYSQGLDGPIAANGRILIRQLVDTRRIDGRNQRMTGQMLAINGILQLQNGLTSAINQLSVDYKNERRSGFTWIGTQPDVELEERVDDGPANSGGDVNSPLVFQRALFGFTLGQGFRTVYNRPNEPSTEQLNQINPGSQSGIGVFDDFGMMFTRPQLTFPMGYIQSSGTARVKWLERGDDPVNDPISTEFNCQ